VPIYEYECNDCRHQFERKQRFDEEPIAICPLCQGKCRRVIHSVPVIFKGSGFYVTDSRGTNSASGKGDKATTEKTAIDKSAPEKAAKQKVSTESE
jgi:putative FmdB family regulatory protein